MQTNTRELIVEKSPEDVYGFIKDPENYLSDYDLASHGTSLIFPSASTHHQDFH